MSAYGVVCTYRGCGIALDGSPVSLLSWHVTCEGWKSVPMGPRDASNLAAGWNAT